MEPAELKSIILDRFRPELGALQVTDVHMRRDRDHEGAPIWRIDLCIDADVSDLGGKRLYSAASEVISELQRRNEAAFPVFSFRPRQLVTTKSA